MKRILLAFLGLSIVVTTAIAQYQDVVSIDTQSHGDVVPPTLYGAFFEEISHAGDGGLYAEMIQNRGFEEGVIPSGCTYRDGEVWAPQLPCYTTDKVNNWHTRWNMDRKSMLGWAVEAEKGTPTYNVTDAEPLNEATPHSLHLIIYKENGTVRVTNSGYWGIALKAGEKYDLRLFIKSKRRSKSVVSARLVDENGTIAAEADIRLKKAGRWNEYTAQLTASKSGQHYSLQLSFPEAGEFFLDHVSLFPVNTYNNRKNGLRADIAQYLVDLKPSFLRWPGGCILEGITMQNAVDWKKTLGDPVTRPGEYDLWGYRNTYGFGYHEFLQFCEDTGIDPMYVCNAGMSCLFRGGDYVEGDELDALVQDCLNAIEYALGDAETTYWGKQRALNGHPEPFPLRYVEVGNENVGPRYAEHYKLFRDAIRERYPQLEVICALMFHPEVPDCGDMDYFDPHYYENADWFYRAANIFDSIPEQYKHNIYIGEYAAGGANMYAALAEAAFLTGCERNGNRVKMTSFAPLFQNIHSGTRHLICYDNQATFGRSNYHIVKAFNDNRPDYNLASCISKTPATKDVILVDGTVGLSTFGNDVEFRDFKLIDYSVFPDETEDYSVANPADDQDDWTEEMDGNQRFLWLKKAVGGKFDVCFRMKKNTGKEACRVMFGWGNCDKRNFYMAEIGSHQNESTIFGERRNGDYTNYFNYRNVESIEQDRWYDVKVAVDNYHWQIYLDGRLVEDYNYDTDLVRHYAIAGKDEKSGDIIVKLVNGENKDWQTALSLGETAKNETFPVSRIIISAANPTDENSIDNPTLIEPKTDALSLAADAEGLFPIDLPANSFTVLRIKTKP